MTALTALTAEVAKMREELNTQHTNILRLQNYVSSISGKISAFDTWRDNTDRLFVPQQEKMREELNTQNAKIQWVQNGVNILEHNVNELKIQVKQLKNVQTTPDDLAKNVLYVLPMV